MAQFKKDRSIRSVGRSQERSPQQLTDAQQVLLSGLVNFCLLNQTAVFIGTPSTSGSIKLNFYLPDDKCSGSLNMRFDWAEDIPDLLGDVFGQTVSLKDLERAVPWLARTAAEAPPDHKRSVRPSELAKLPETPS